MLQLDVNFVEVVLQDGMRFEARNERGATATLDAAPPGGEGAGMTPMEFLRLDSAAAPRWTSSASCGRNVNR